MVEFGGFATSTVRYAVGRFPPPVATPAIYPPVAPTFPVAKDIYVLDWGFPIVGFEIGSEMTQAGGCSALGYPRSAGMLRQVVQVISLASFGLVPPFTAVPQ